LELMQARSALYLDFVSRRSSVFASVSLGAYGIAGERWCGLHVVRREHNLKSN